MGHLILSLVVYTVLAAVAPQVFPGVRVRDAKAAVGVAVVFGLLNMFLGWALSLLVGVVSLPAIILSGGLFLLLVPVIANAVLLRVADSLLDSFDLSGWMPAFGMGALFGVGGWLLGRIG